MMETQEYQTILVGVDGSEQADQAFDKAVAVARRNQATIIIAHVLENHLFENMGYTFNQGDMIQIETDRSKELLNRYQQRADAAGVKQSETVLAFGSPKTVMAHDLPEKYQVDLMMVGQSGLNAVERFVMGSVSSYVIRNATCDVLIVRPVSVDTKKDER